MFASRRLLPLLLAAALSCGPRPAPAPTAGPSAATAAPTPAAPAAAGASADPTPPAHRLPAGVRPVRYDVRLTLNPAAPTFRGAVNIDLELAAPTQVVWLHAEELTLHAATAAAGGAPQPARVVEPAGPEHFVALVLPGALGPGPARVHIEYEGKVSPKDVSGVFAQEESDARYLFTQFEAISARRAIPCFDEPGFKVPWRLTLTVPKGNLAFANTPVEAERELEGGAREVRFAESKPLPSYLVAFAVGPFEIVNLGALGAAKTPTRLIVPRGRVGQAQYAAATLPPLLDLLEQYFGMPYPYEKLDYVAVPQFFGGMENAGLITHAQPRMLAEAGRETDDFKRGFAGIAAHELAHQWFGDLVTPAWWDDLWLNESFATWMALKITAQWQPSWELRTEALAERHEAMRADSLATARKIHQPLESTTDLAGAFNPITYGKGAAVLGMFEEWLGEETFRTGVRAFMTKHQWGSATAQDFLAAVGAAAGRDVAPAFKSFLEQPGVPLLTVNVGCPKGAPPRVTVSQERYLPMGSTASREQTWQIPVCVTFGVGRTVGRECSLVTEATAELPLASAPGCPAWLLANAGAVGYFRVNYQNDLLARLLHVGAAHLTLTERVSVLDDVNALMESGRIPAGGALGLVPKLAKDKSRVVVEASIAMVLGAERFLVPDAQRPRFAHFVHKSYARKLEQLGWRGAENETDDQRLLRPAVLSVMAVQGEDRAVAQEARRLALRSIDQPDGLAPNLVGPVLAIAAHHGDRALYDRLLAAARAATDPGKQRRLLSALGGFRDPALLEQNLNLLLGDDFGFQQTMPLLQMALARPATRERAYAFFKENYDAIARRIPSFYHAYLPLVAAAFCDEQHLADAEAFFTPRMEKVQGGKATLANALEEVKLCNALRTAQQPSVEAFLKKY